jgi:IS30 family transposase
MTLANISKKDYRGIIPARVDIDERPVIVDEKTRLGDWKADMVVSALNNSLGSP